MMDELIGRLVADSGVDRTATLGAVGIIANFPLEETPLEKAQIEILRRRRVSATETTWRITRWASPLPAGRAVAAARGMSTILVAATRDTLTFMREPGSTQSATSLTRPPRSAGATDA